MNLTNDQNLSGLYVIFYLLEAFSRFPALRELELSLNGLSTVEINPADFPRLEVGCVHRINAVEVRSCYN